MQCLPFRPGDQVVTIFGVKHEFIGVSRDGYAYTSRCSDGKVFEFGWHQIRKEGE